MGHAEDINTARGQIMAGKRWGRPELVEQGYETLRRVRIERAKAALEAAENRTNENENAENER